MFRISNLLMPSVGATSTPSVSMPTPVRTDWSMSFCLLPLIISPAAIFCTTRWAITWRECPSFSSARMTSVMPGGPTIPSTRAATSAARFISTNGAGSTPLPLASSATEYACSRARLRRVKYACISSVRSVMPSHRSLCPRILRALHRIVQSCSHAFHLSYAARPHASVRSAIFPSFRYVPPTPALKPM